jgi:aspartate/methionine/tyrosine aminotransferase
LILVNPNNPTGNYLSSRDQELLGPYLAAHSLAYISDEVFFDFPYPGQTPKPWNPPGCLSFRLGGISKSLGLPQLKLSWIVMEGPEKEVRECRERIEVIADSYLSVNSPVQAALPKLLEWAPDFRSQVLDRILANRRSLEEALANQEHLRLWPAQGGWYALVEVKNHAENDEALAIELLKKEGVLTHPGGFYDLVGGTFLVLSLLPPGPIFAEGIGRMVRFLKKGPL